MRTHRLPRPAAWTARRGLLTRRAGGALLAGAALLAGCGGGSLETTVPVANSASISTAGVEGVSSYGKKLLITVQGSQLDRGISVLALRADSTGTALFATACGGMTQLTTAPNVSTPNTAYYECTVQTDGPAVVQVYRNNTDTGSPAVIQRTLFTIPSPQVTMTIGNGTRTLGDVVLTLEPSKTPATVANFMRYVNDGFYDGTVFHRHSPNFVLQGGGYASGLNPANSTTPTLKATNPAITLEDNAGLSNLQWTVAMARTNAPDSATSQFFINLVDNLFLDRALPTGSRGYAVFGTVTAGREVVTAMRAEPCVPYPALGLPSGDCLPLPNLVVTSARQTR